MRCILGIEEDLDQCTSITSCDVYLGTVIAGNRVHMHMHPGVSKMSLIRIS